MVQPVGHVDFYPNSGRQQPGCSLVDIPLTLIEEGLYDAGRDFVACNHDRSIEFFNNSILTGCSFVGYECPDYDSYLKVILIKPRFNLPFYDEIRKWWYIEGWTNDLCKNTVIIIYPHCGYLINFP